MKPWLLRIFVIASFLTQEVPAAIVRTLPADGTWATYYYTQHYEQNGAMTDQTSGTLTVRSVGQTVRNGVPCRWIEIEYRQQSADGSQSGIEVRRHLIPEDSIGSDTGAVDRQLEVWVKFDSQDAVQEQTDGGFGDEWTLPMPFISHEVVPGEHSLSYQRGKMALDTKHIGITQRKFGERFFIRTEHEFWMHPESPFGTAIIHQRFHFHRSLLDPPSRVIVRHLELTDFGTGAVAALPISS